MGETRTLTKEGVATEGAYTNDATVTATGELSRGAVTDSDPSNYTAKRIQVVSRVPDVRLPFTGANISGLLVMAFLLGAAGMAFLIIGRRVRASKF